MNASSGEAERFGSDADLAGLVLTEETISSILEMVVGVAVSALPEVAGASVSVVKGKGRFETTNASSQSVRAVDEGQYEDGAGPCIQALRTGREVKVSLPCPQWPIFTARAQEAGLGSVMSLPLQAAERTTGALNLYFRHSAGGEGPGADAARSLARQAGTVLANAAALMGAELTNRHLEEALASRDLIGQAKGILMAREGIDADAAFDILRRASQRTDRKLRDIAAEVVSHLGITGA